MGMVYEAEAFPFDIFLFTFLGIFASFLVLVSIHKVWGLYALDSSSSSYSFL